MPNVEKTQSIKTAHTGQSKPRKRSYISTSKHYGTSEIDKESAANARGRILTLSPNRTTKKKKKKKKKTNPPRNKKGSDRYSIPADAHRRPYSPKEVIAILKRNGWVEIKGKTKGKGSHTNYKNSKKPELGRITFSNTKRLYFMDVVRTLDKAGLLDQLPREKPSSRHKAQK